MKYITIWFLIASFDLLADPVLHDTEQFRVYTFVENQDRTSEVIESVQKAYDAFELYFSLHAMPLTIIAFPSASALQEMNLEAFEARGKLLPFLIEADANGRSSSNDTNSSQLYPALGVKVIQSGPTWVVEEVIEQIVLLNGLSDIQKGDRLISINEQLLAETLNLNDMIQGISAGDQFSLVLERNKQKLNLSGKMLNLQTQQQKPKQQEKSPKIMLGALQHEIGHMLLMAIMDDEDVESQRKQSKSNQARNQPRTYGSLKTPDWLDEMVANMCEGDEVKTIHKNSIKALSDLMPLKELLTTRHPSLDSILSSQAYKDRVKKSDETQTIVLSLDDFTEKERQQIISGTGTFYGSSLLLGEFLYHQGGSHLLKTIIEEINTKPGITFTDLIQQIDSLENTTEAIEMNFHRFVALKLGIK